MLSGFIEVSKVLRRGCLRGFYSEQRCLHKAELSGGCLRRFSVFTRKDECSNLCPKEDLNETFLYILEQTSNVDFLVTKPPTP